MPFDRRRGGSQMMMRYTLFAQHLLLALFNQNGGSIGSGNYTPQIGSSIAFVVNDGTFTEGTGGLAFISQSTPTWGDMGFYHSAGVARANGRAFIFKATLSTINAMFHGFLSGAALNTGFGAPMEDMGYFDGAGPRYIQVKSGTNWYELFAPPATATEYQIAIVLRSAGSFLCIKGGVFSDWTLLFPNVQGSDALVHAGVSNYQSAGTITLFGVADLLVGWSDDYSIATQRLAGARDPGDTFVHEANGLIEFTVGTRPSSGSIELRFRIQDASNHMRVTISSTGAIGLDEVVAGVPSSLGSAAGVVSNGHRVVVRFNGSNVQVHSGAVGDEERRISSGSASSFTSETDGELESEGTGGAVTNIVSYPRTLAGRPRQALIDAFST